MFTLDQLQQAHRKVKSGADFPAYIREIKAMGVKHYETYVSDGHTIYYGTPPHQVSAPAKYPAQPIAKVCDTTAFKTGLKEHQVGKSDYPTFIRMSAQQGIEKWEVNMAQMTCTYFDKAGNAVLLEQIPE